MSRAGILLGARSWAESILAALGLTLLLASCAALFGPLPWLDAAIARGEAQLIAGISSSFAILLLLFRVAARPLLRLRPRAIAPRRMPTPRPPSGRTHLR
jgi:hypothetical protein